MTGAEVDALFSLSMELRPPGRVVVGRLFGHAAGVGQDPRTNAHVVRELDPSIVFDSAARRRAGVDDHATEWVQLLTLRTCDELEVHIWDEGYLQVLIRADDLAARRLDRLYASIEAS